MKQIGKEGNNYNVPAIKAGVGVAGVVTTAGLAIYATPKAHDRMSNILDEEKGNKKAIAIRTLKEVVPCYIPTILSGAIAISCIVSSHKELSKKSAALATLYAASDQALKSYQHKAIERMGEKWHETTLHESNTEIIKSRPSTIIAGTGKVVCYDKPSGDYFETDMQTIRAAVNDINASCIDQQFAGLNDFRLAIGMKALPLGNGKGWTASDGYLNVRYDAQLNENDEPVLVIDYEIFDTL